MTEQTSILSLARVALLATGLSAVGAGVLAGVFYAFSTSVMTALDQLPAPQAVVAMQTMNVTIVNPVFLFVLVGSTCGCLVVLGTAPFSGLPHAGLRMAGAAIFLVGAIGVTAAVNIPLNDALAAADPQSGDAISAWREFAGRWTRFNDLRAGASVIATALLVVAGWPTQR